MCMALLPLRSDVLDVAIDTHMHGRMHGHKDARMHRCMYVRTHRRTDASMHACTHARMNA